MSDHGNSHAELTYSAGVNRICEPVISSHFMRRLSEDPDLALYDEERFGSARLVLGARTVRQTLLPGLLRASDAFARERAAAALQAARRNYREYGLTDPDSTGLGQWITEVMFDRQYRRGTRHTCSRIDICRKALERIARGAPIEMAIPALPFKFSSPLKARGELPDLAEVNFLLSLYEIARSIELIYRQERPDLRGPCARFTVVSDGRRFSRLVRVPDSVIETYQVHVDRWIRALQLEDYIQFIDYERLLRALLPGDVHAARRRFADRALSEYTTAMGSIFDPNDMAATLRNAARVDPDPEASNSEGRFVSLVKSLVYTIRYRCLEDLVGLDAVGRVQLYRELTLHIFDSLAPSDATKELLRRAMLHEVWTAAIGYMAEIRSDRDLPIDPILSCLPDHFRWTIHPKPGQLALFTCPADGLFVQAWAGTAVFKYTRSRTMKLCTLPVLALEGRGARPIQIDASDDDLDMGDQPLFYIDPAVTAANGQELVNHITQSLVRTRST